MGIIKTNRFVRAKKIILVWKKERKRPNGGRRERGRGGLERERGRGVRGKGRGEGGTKIYLGDIFTHAIIVD